MSQDPASPSIEVALDRCQDLPPVAVVTTLAPVGGQQALYVASGDRLYAVHASDGMVGWCQQVKVTREPTYPPGRFRRPRRPDPRFGTPRVVNGTVYVCVSGYGQYTCAFNAEDGTLSWRTPTDAWIVDIPFEDFAVPMVNDGIVYTGTYALSAQDGSVLRRIAIDEQWPWVSPQALMEGTLYAVSQKGVYAINEQTGTVDWLYQYEYPTIVSGPPVVFDQLLYVGTQGSVDHEDASYFCALDTETGRVRWRYSMGTYRGADVDNEWVYASSRDRYLYALGKRDGSLHWKYQFASMPYQRPTIADNVVYFNRDEAYAFNSADGAVLWHQQLGNGHFTPSVILDGVVYLASFDGYERSILYALNASNGTEYWHSDYPQHIIPLAVAG
ncbi:MAG: PQQ-binding-like beta-propeller repeat protein [Ktedonobacterales bacterium]